MPNEIVTLWIRQATTAGKSLDQIDEEIIGPAKLSEQQKGALLLFAYSLRRRGEQRRYAREGLAITGMSLPRAAWKHRSRALWGSVGTFPLMSDERVERGDLVVKRDGSSPLLVRVIAVEEEGALTGTYLTPEGQVHGVRGEPVENYRLATAAERQAAVEGNLLPPD
jgi:hypothetical protein